MTFDEFMAAQKSAAKTRKRPSDEEHRIQCVCVRWFALQYPRLKGRLFAVPNGGRRDATTAAKYNSFVDDNCKVTSKDAIQGSQADFILVDRTDWSDDKYLLLRDFYTMMSRAKTGVAFVDGDYLSKLDITFEKTDSASVRLSDEQFLAAIENYKT